MTDANTLMPTDADIIALADKTRTGEPLKDSQIADIYFEALGSQHLREQDRKTVARFACAVEAEVQKQDEALIWLMLTALEHHTEQTRQIARTDDAITAALLRLKGKP